MVSRIIDGKMPSKKQIVFDDILFRNHPDKFSELAAFAGAYRARHLDARWFVRAVIQCFRDDHGEDWIDDKKSLNRLAKAICEAKP